MLPNTKVRFTHPDSIGKLFGFEGEYTTREHPNIFISDKEMKTIFKDPINVYLNCINNNYFNNEKSSIVYSFYHKECMVNENPNTLIYHPIKENITKLKVEIKDKDGNEITLDKCFLKFHIKK